MTVLFVLSLLAYLFVIGYFIYCTGEDARSWVTPFDQWSHPYSRKTQLLLIPVLLGWMLPIVVWDL